MKRFVIGIITLFSIVAILAIAAFFGVGFYLSPQSPLVKSDVIVAISGGDTAARTKEAVRLYHEGYAPKIIFSGAALDPNGPSNAKAMASAAETQGVPPSAIALDETAVNTRQNASNVAGLITSANDHSIILVTSPYHQRRAYIVFHRVLGPNVTITNHSSYDSGWRRSHWWATPDSRALTLSEFQKTIYELVSGSK
jgi:uncharacterized SAM-binding protein YcdF (DUF218 family)